MVFVVGGDEEVSEVGAASRGGGTCLPASTPACLSHSLCEISKREKCLDGLDA